MSCEIWIACFGRAFEAYIALLKLAMNEKCISIGLWGSYTAYYLTLPNRNGVEKTYEEEEYSPSFSLINIE